jgi:hypothetical protein
MLQGIDFLVSVQHDCCLKRCKASGSRPERQERQDTSRVVQIIEHADDDHFVINMHAMHNAHHMRWVLSRELIRPRHTHANRAAWHHEISHNMHANQEQKRADANAKRKATLQKNKEAAAKANSEAPPTTSKRPARAPKRRRGALVDEETDGSASNNEEA